MIYYSVTHIVHDAEKMMVGFHLDVSILLSIIFITVGAPLCEVGGRRFRWPGGGAYCWSEPELCDDASVSGTEPPTASVICTQEDPNDGDARCAALCFRFHFGCFKVYGSMDLISAYYF